MKNLKVSMKLMLSFSLVIVLTVALVEMGLWGMKRIKIASDDMYYYNVNAVDTIGLIRENFASQRYTTRELIIYDSSSEEYREVKRHLEVLESEMKEHMNAYSLTILTEEDSALFERFQSVYYDYYVPFKLGFIELADQNKSDAVVEHIRTNGRPIVDDILTILQEAHNYNASAAKSALEHNENLYVTMRNTALGVLTVAVIIVVFLIIRLRNLISTPLIVLSSALDYMGRTGDLKLGDEMLEYAETTSDRKDEIGRASLAVVRLLKHIWVIEHVISRISDGDFTAEVKSLSDRDTLGLSVSKVTNNLNLMFQGMKDAEEEARTASKAKSAFLSHISHEIRTPLSAITGMAAIARKANGDQTKIAACIEQIMASSRHLLSILNDVLDMSKIESGKLELSNEPFCLCAVFNEVFGIISQGCADKNITFTTDIAQAKDMMLIGDKMRVNQVLINLLGNAVKFTPKGGSISCSVNEIEKKGKTVRYKFVITDTGIGMSEEQVAKLFAPFEQTKNDIAARFGGTGLGLSISQNLVKMMRGVISVESELNVGTCFSFELGFEQSETSSDKPDEMISAVDFRGNRILLVEDIEINRIIVRELLAETGIEIVEAMDGKEAVNMVENSDTGYFDLILMDVQMPVMDGYEAARQIRGLDREDAKRVPILAMTANAYKEDIDDALAAGMNAHLAKPIDVELLIETLTRFFRKGK